MLILLLETSWPEAFFGIGAMAVIGAVVIAFFYFNFSDRRK